jgi:hypothetical protein
MASNARRRRKRRAGEYRAPTTRREARQQKVDAGAPVSRRPARPRGGRRDPRERPPSPWGAFPLVELTILIALVLLLVGFFVGQTRGIIMIFAGMALASLAALELVLREHFAGYRSHTTVLAGFVALIVLGLGFVLEWPQIVKVGAGAGAFAVCFYLFREAFKRRSGGLGFR